MTILPADVCKYEHLTSLPVEVWRGKEETRWKGKKLNNWMRNTLCNITETQGTTMASAVWSAKNEETAYLTFFLMNGLSAYRSQMGCTDEEKENC